MEYSRFENEQRSRVLRLSFSRWIWAVVAWDGILPTIVLGTPLLIQTLLPQNRGLIEASAVLLPILAFFARLQIGARHIGSNRCGPLLRRFQINALCLGAFLLIMVDCLAILAIQMPAGVVMTTLEDLIILTAIACVYLTLMTFAMYPGRDLVDAELENWYATDAS